MRTTAAAFALALLVAAGCEGPMGPAGPQGAPGERGPAGTPHYFSGIVGANGGLAIQLPVEAGTLTNPPGLFCYMREPGGTVWLIIGLDITNEIACGLVSSGGMLTATAIGVLPGYTVLFVVFY